MKKKMSIIIPTLNKLYRLKLVLKSLEKQITNDIEVIIVFDGCDKKVVNDFQSLIFNFKPVTIICEKNVGRSVARNKGLAIATGDIIVFLDDDRIVCPDFIERHLKAHNTANGPVAVLGGRKELFLSDEEIESMGNSFEGVIDICKQHEQPFYYPYRKKENDSFRWVNFFTGNVSVDRKSLEKAGCFDEWFIKWGCEDIDLGIRLCLEKVRFFYDDNAVNYHMMHESNFEDQSEQLLFNLKYIIKKYRWHFMVKIGLYKMYIDNKFKKVQIAEELKKRYEIEKSKSRS